MIRVVDYGVGNIQAFMTVFKRLGIEAQRATAPADLSGATRLIIPGVGHFDQAMGRLNGSGLRPALESMVLGQSVPVLGVCGYADVGIWFRRRQSAGSELGAWSR